MRNAPGPRGKTVKGEHTTPLETHIAAAFQASSAQWLSGTASTVTDECSRTAALPESVPDCSATSTGKYNSQIIQILRLFRRKSFPVRHYVCDK